MAEIIESDDQVRQSLEIARRELALEKQKAVDQSAGAASSSGSTATVSKPPIAGARTSAGKSVGQGELWWSVKDAMTISSAVLVFGVFIFLISAYLIKLGKSAEAVLRVMGTMLIIVAALFLVVAGYTDTQIAPVMGLLGTIAGYLLGKSGEEKKSDPATAPAPAPPQA
jgi:VIT1/CCC1 family predicted Fe2+/Mn2+ transporter